MLAKELGLVVREVTTVEYVERARRMAPRHRRMFAPETFSSDYLSDVGARCFLTDGLAGFYLVKDELRGLFSFVKGEGAKALAAAVELGARRLDVFDIGLVAWYEARGWREVRRVPFDPAIAPDGWFDLEPDVVFMEHGG